ncbi:hypothetical protein B0H17DRAFT_407184 [Mycena rosella]|uniref:Secreted protein n=1 Tax=Mycena rosella TaxID=1033263 RepID=A0AAD7GLA4_MYCRO|nr:hypothetical protein B0H17DRAFT_407184 [Mycena rosella]
MRRRGLGTGRRRVRGRRLRLTCLICLTTRTPVPAEAWVRVGVRARGRDKCAPVNAHRVSSRYGLILLEALHIIDSMYPTSCFSYLSPFLLALLQVPPHYFNVV